MAHPLTPSYIAGMTLSVSVVVICETKMELKWLLRRQLLMYSVMKAVFV